LPHPILPTVQWEPDCHTIHVIIKLLRSNALGHLGIIISIAAYVTVATADPWVNPTTPGWEPNELDGDTAAQLALEHHHWEEAVVTFRTWNNFEQALKK
jgi:hypothetical protein